MRWIGEVPVRPFCLGTKVSIAGRSNGDTTHPHHWKIELRMNSIEDDDVAWLRWHITHLVRIWTVLGMFRGTQGNEACEVVKDVCSDKLRIMLHELANKKTWTVGFDADGTQKHKRRYAKLAVANEWFTGKNNLHARNCSGAHLQRLPAATHMFQTFGYGGEREWKKLTLGVAACVSMMKLIEKGRLNGWWRDVRLRVRKGEMHEHEGLSLPIAFDSLLVGAEGAVSGKVAMKESGYSTQ